MQLVDMVLLRKQETASWISRDWFSYWFWRLSETRLALYLGILEKLVLFKLTSSIDLLTTYPLIVFASTEGTAAIHYLAKCIERSRRGVAISFSHHLVQQGHADFAL